MSAQQSYKIVVVGSTGVGKTAIVQRLVDGTFQNEGQSTVGVEFKSFTVKIDEQSIKLNIWDTAGQERFRSVSKAYFRNAVGAILTFGVNDSQSFNDLDAWLTDLHALSTPNAVILLVGNKADLPDRQITDSEAQGYAQRHALEYLETSALDGTNINEVFVRLARSINDKIKKGEISGSFHSNPVPTPPPVGIANNKNNNQGGSCC